MTRRKRTSNPPYPKPPGKPGPHISAQLATKPCDDSSMPKKRFTSQYSKPQSTVHPSLSSPATTGSSSNHNDAKPTVNELISSSRKSATSNSNPTPATVTAHTLPPQIRQLLSQPETPAPRPRARERRRLDANGRILPPGPAPPRSWLADSRYAPLGLKESHRIYPRDIHDFPGLPKINGRSLQGMCIRAIARNWEMVQDYERYNLVHISTSLKMVLLSNIVVYGPDDGVGFEGLKTLLILPPMDGDESYHFDAGAHNEGLYRLDLSGAMGRSISFKQLTELVRNPDPLPDDEVEAWDEGPSQLLSPPIRMITHLSLSYPSPSVSWSRLLSFAQYIPTLTHLSLRYWPVPTLTPNSKTAVIQTKFGSFQYGATGYYSHSVDEDYREAADVLRRLAVRLYALEYLDLTGCNTWLEAFLWYHGSQNLEGVNWRKHWVKLHTLRLNSGITLTEDSTVGDVIRYHREQLGVRCVEDRLAGSFRQGNEARRTTWIDLEKDDLSQYDGLWLGDGDEDKRKRELMKNLKDVAIADASRNLKRLARELPIATNAHSVEAEVERRSVWDQ